MADSFGLGDVKDTLLKVYALTANVDLLQIQMERSLDQLSSAQDDIRALRADLRVLREELKGEAKQIALDTIINAHTQILERVIDLERHQEDLLALGEQARADGDLPR